MTTNSPSDTPINKDISEILYTHAPELTDTEHIKTAQALNAYISKEKARELKRIEPKGSDRPLIWTTGNDPDTAITIDERIIELDSV